MVIHIWSSPLRLKDCRRAIQAQTCGSILDQNWGTKNSRLIGGKLVFRLERSLSCRSPAPLRTARSWHGIFPFTHPRTGGAHDGHHRTAGIAGRSRRRSGVAALGGAAVWPLAAHGQQPAKLPTVGFIGSDSPDAYTDRLRAFRVGLKATGFIEGQNVAIEYRWAEGRKPN